MWCRSKCAAGFIGKRRLQVLTGLNHSSFLVGPCSTNVEMSIENKTNNTMVVLEQVRAPVHKEHELGETERRDERGHSLPILVNRQRRATAAPRATLILAVALLKTL
jgi:hypothetical protein